MYRIGILEDNPEEARGLGDNLTRYAKAHGELFDLRFFRTAEQLVSSGERLDLMFLDIDLPGISGMDAATLIRSYDDATPLVFVTSLAQYAVRGYEVDALDFMVKPVSYGSLSLRMDKALRVMRRNDSTTTTIPTKDGLRIVRLSEICYVEASGHYCIYHLEGGGELRARASISSIAADLPESQFVRISVSHILNMGSIVWIRGNAVRLSTDETLYLSRSRKREALETITSYLGKSL